MIPSRGLVILLVIACLPPGSGAVAQRAKGPRKVDKPPVVLPPPAAPATASPAPEGKPYDGQLMRLAEILGALTTLSALCGEKGADEWRQRMQVLLEAEGQPPIRRDRLAGAYNEGLKGYELTYRTCTANARAVITRFLAEGGRLAQDLENRFRAS